MACSQSWVRAQEPEGDLEDQAPAVRQLEERRESSGNHPGKRTRLNPDPVGLCLSPSSVPMGHAQVHALGGLKEPRHP